MQILGDEVMEKDSKSADSQRGITGEGHNTGISPSSDTGEGLINQDSLVHGTGEGINSSPSVTRTEIAISSARDLPPEFFKKSHELTFAHTELTPREMDLMGMFFAQLHQDHWIKVQALSGGKRINLYVSAGYTFSSKAIAEWMGISEKHVYTTIAPMAERLTSKTIGVKDDTLEEFKFRPLFSEISYRQGNLRIVPNSELMEAYVAYSKGFALVRHQPYRDLKSGYSKRIYEMLSRFKEMGVLQPQTLDDMKRYLGVVDRKGQCKSTFTSTSRFIKQCIEAPIAEMMGMPAISKELTFLKDPDSERIGYRVKNHGRKITHIEFLFVWRDINAEMTLIRNATTQIAELEYRRIMKKERLTLKELDLLYDCYVQVGDTSKAETVKTAIKNRSLPASPSLESAGEAVDYHELTKLLTPEEVLARLSRIETKDPY